jgi:carboxyl-terminal processing protease
MKLKKILIVFFSVVLIFGIFASGFYFGKSKCKICPPKDINFSLFWEAFYKLRENFLEKEKFEIQKIIYGAIEGMTKSLGDPYTTFFTPDETKRFEEEVRGKFEGVGMEIGIKKGKLKVIAPLEGTPAKRAGILAGDEILKIDGKSTEGLSVEEAAILIRGPKGTEVTLTIYREDWEKPRDFKLVRDVIKIPVVKWELKEDNIAYIKIYQFLEPTGIDFSRTAGEILNSPAKKIILDLRDNSGGLLDEVVKVSGWFLKIGEIVTIEKREGKEKPRYSLGPAEFLKYPVVVLINRGSASAAEILAAALRENRGIILIGENSFGKGTVQEPFFLSDGSSLKITIAEWLTPKGNSISEIGLKPDIEIKMTEEDYEKGFDPQLEKAIEIIKGI